MPASASSARSTACHVVTVEHLRGDDGALHPVQQAMVDHPRLAMRLLHAGLRDVALWPVDAQAGRRPTPAIEKALQGNLCRCTGYAPIVRAARGDLAATASAAHDPLAAEREAITAQLCGHATTARASRSARATSGYRAGRRRRSGRGARRASPDATIVAGSTDVGLWVTKFMRDIAPVDLHRPSRTSCSAIAEADGRCRIGAGVTYSRGAGDARRTHSRTSAPLIDRIGGEQVRNMGTIGGNIANGSPIGDTPPPLIALGATLMLRTRRRAARRCRWRISSSPMASRTAQPGEFVESGHRAACPAERARVRRLQDHQAPRRGHLRRARRLPPGARRRRHGRGDPHRLRRHGGDAEAGARGGGGADRQAVDRGDGRGGACRPSPRISRR